MWVSPINTTVDSHTCPHGDRADRLGASGYAAEAATAVPCIALLPWQVQRRLALQQFSSCYVLPDGGQPRIIEGTFC